MANKLDPMDLKQIITLHLDGASNRRIASVLGISRNTVNTYMKLLDPVTIRLKISLALIPAFFPNCFLPIVPLMPIATMSLCCT